MASKPAWRFQYVGTTPASTGLVEIVRGKQGKVANPDEAGVLFPHDEVVVDDPGVAGWLRSLLDFKEVNSPTSDKATHRKPKAKPKAAPKPKAG